MSEQATHQHKKRGTEYVLIGIGKMQAEHWRDHGQGPFEQTVDMRDVAIYRSASEQGEFWVRPLEEFNDGRFEVLPSQATSAPTGLLKYLIMAAEELEATSATGSTLDLIRQVISEAIAPITPLPTQEG